MSDTIYCGTTPTITVTGTAARADDVSPLPHNLSWTQYGQSVQDGTPTPSAPIAIVGKTAGLSVLARNLFNINNIITTSSIINNGDGTITVNAYSISTGKNLRELLPNVAAGMTVMFRQDNTAESIYNLIYCESSWYSGTAKTLTNTMLDSRVFLYCKRVNGVNYPVTLSNIQFELGSTATTYAPYVAPVTEVITDASGNPITLYGIPVSSGGNITIGTQQYIADTVDNTGLITRRVGYIASYAGETISTAYMSTTGSLTTGASVYYAAVGLGMRLEPDGSVTVRNASPSAKILADGFQFSLTYVLA